MSPQSNTSGAGTVIDGFSVSGTTVIVEVFLRLLLQASVDVHSTVIV